MRQLILLLFIFITACNEKKIRILHSSKEEGRRSVRLFYEVFPDSCIIGNNKYPTSEYYTVYSVYFPLEDHEHYKKINSDELKEYFPDIDFSNIQRKFEELKESNAAFTGCRLYHGLDSTTKKIRTFKSENFLVFIKKDTTQQSKIVEDLNEVYKIENHIFDLRGFTEKRNKLKIMNYHLSCAPNCPKPDLISDN